MTGSQKVPVSRFVTEMLVAGKRRAAKTRNVGGYAALYSEIARAVLKAYPNLTPEEKASVFGTFKGEAETARIRTGQDHTMGLRDAARILGIQGQ